jgi:hypothetical protein
LDSPDDDAPVVDHRSDGDLGRYAWEQRDEFVRRGFAADVTLGLTAACFFAVLGTVLLLVGEPTFGTGMLAVAPWIVVLDLQDYWRWIGFMQGTPKKSLHNDLLFNTVQALAFAVVLLTVSTRCSRSSRHGAWELPLPPSTVFGNSPYDRRFTGGWPFSDPVGPRAGGWRASAPPAGGRPSSI